ncbi:MAG: helix-turn-helix domain-containing protein [Oscillospiraceae bacterium]|nr:helix-turn-helix domain-containing protein [Oscillospiraceae bacterium]
MRESFCRTLSLLRRDKGVSQKTASTELGISQALLSHYEKGTREPGLAFVVRACEYYGVSADFLLGRTMLRDGTLVSPEALHDAADDKDNRLRGNVSALLHKKLLISAISLLFDLLGRSRDKALIDSASAYLSDAVYIVFRHLYEAAGDNPAASFGIPGALFSLAAAADMARREAQLSSRLCRAKGKRDKRDDVPTIPPLSHDMLLSEYPQLAQSLYMLLQQTGERIQFDADVLA